MKKEQIFLFSFFISFLVLLFYFCFNLEYENTYLSNISSAQDETVKSKEIARQNLVGVTFIILIYRERKKAVFAWSKAERE